MMILAKRDSVARIIVVSLCERDQVGRIDNVKATFQNDSQTACRTAVVVGTAHHPAECSVAHGFKNVCFRDSTAFIESPLKPVPFER
jgi:hypothetical protein